MLREKWMDLSRKARHGLRPIDAQKLNDARVK